MRSVNSRNIPFRLELYLGWKGISSEYRFILIAFLLVKPFENVLTIYFFCKTPASEYQNKGMQKFPLHLQLHNRVELRIKVIIWSNLPPESGYRIQPVLIQQEAYLTLFRELFTLVTSGYKGILQFTIVKTQRKLCKRRNILKPCYRNEKNVATRCFA